MRLTPLRRSGLLGAAALVAVATLSLVTTAFAQPDKPALDSGDQRAVAYDGNVEWNWKTACTVGGLTGTSITSDKFTFTGGKGTPDVDITVIPSGVTITGVVVKGGDAYNVYLADKLGALPWNDLRSPFNNGGQIPGISHWYACGVDKEQTSSSSSSTTSSSTVTHSSTPSSSETTTPSSSEVVTTTTTTTTVAAPVDEDLASTGFGSAWLVGLGAALLAAGAAVLLVLRRRRA
ncbi:LPXTG cell wall anchor domain-containing protein [Lentzea sp. NPDC006480]|uniref:LPXTG cell wall anchor domain-containing protein n=1 Tax=Lentzea sp. NPDC006480 TaxID=3157176 RepID=UPI0033AE3086